MRQFDTDTIQLITAFENMTKTEVRDCHVDPEVIYFLVGTGKIAVAIGKNGQTIKSAEYQFKKQIKIFEWAEDPKDFIKNMIPSATKISIKDDIAQVSIDSKSRGAVLGKGGSNIKVIREFLERNSTIKELKIL
ncbi:MAG: NusA-like transcription termination signal-binding factor [Candidatus Aenigmarchaeota archaeon]|nr:NusA-like transcription termination signal-binding factor [Candidatus Aenigmarchaeota archaeon]